MYGKRKLVSPRNGHTLVVGVVARISGCADQKELSLDDQIDHAKEALGEFWDGPLDLRTIATKGKGEALDRPELVQVRAAYSSRDFDMFIIEDLGRLIRGGDAVELLAVGVDHGVRTVVINDCIDTNDENWESDALAASADHVGHNAHTSKRIKKKCMNRFEKFGGVPGRPIAGYSVPAGAKTYTEWQKEPNATPILQEGAKRLLGSQPPNCSAVADWFNAISFAVGPYCRKPMWDGKMVRRLYANPLLKGMPERGNHHTVKHHASGRRKSEKNPDGPSTWLCPHLAHLAPATFDDLNAWLKAQNANLGRKSVNGVDPRYRVSRKRTVFPGQWGCCWYCGRHHVWGGNGMPGHLMCSGSRNYLCWNSIGYDGSLAVAGVRQAITDALYELDAFDDQFRELVCAATSHVDGDAAQHSEKLQRGANALEQKRRNVMSAIADYGPRPEFKTKLAEIDEANVVLDRERRALESLRSRKLELPESTSALRSMLEAAFTKSAAEQFEFGDLLRKLVPSFYVYLVRSCDGGHLLPRARVTLALDGFIPDAKHVPNMTALTQREVTLDLFQKPQRERIRIEAVKLATEGLGPKDIAARISEGGIERPSSTAVLNALKLDAVMKAQGLSNPYVLVREPPADYAKLRRHRNGKYTFTLRDPYVVPALLE